MKRSFVAHVFAAGLVAAVMAVCAAPAQAQVGTLKGKVVDEQGKPVASVNLVFEFQGELSLRFTGKTDAKGEYTRAGLSATGQWSVLAKKDNLSGAARNVAVASGGSSTAPDIVLKAGSSGTVDVSRAQRAELQKYMGEIDAAMAIKDYATAIAKLTDVAGKLEKCVVCYLQMGDTYMKKAADESGDAQKASYDSAEKSYLKAVEIDDKSAEAYDVLATFYNQQRRLDDAAKMSMKAAEVRGAAGTADPTSAFNAGVIFWNASKIPEAKAQFQKAVELAPTMAEAHYYLGMCLVNEGKVPEAKAALEQYLKLAPTGPNAPTAKAVIDSLPK